MAIDEAVASAVAEQSVPPTLRFYGWSRPTLSLGYFQSIGDAGPWSESDIDLVRRSTGGGAIMHHHELTYSLSLPLTDSQPGAREGMYRGVHSCVIASLREMNVASFAYRDTIKASFGSVDVSRLLAPELAPAGLRPSAIGRNEPFLCFERRTDEDLICGGYKILGSAQRRVRGGVVQHGSLLLSVSPHTSVLPGIVDLTAVNVKAGPLSQLISDRIGEAMSIRWQSGELSDAEREASTRSRADRYADAKWTRRR